jgi:superfamily II DNA helicase RecQ
LHSNGLYRQAGHGRRVAQQHYAIDGAFLHRLGPELITAFEQASIAWHRLWRLKSIGSGGSGSGRSISSTSASVAVGHRREASQQLVPILPARRVKSKHTDTDSNSQALIGLQRIYQDPKAKPRSEGQAVALQLVHNPSPNVPLVIVLPTSSGKSALFFSVAAMTSQQTVIVVVPFAALVDDIVVRGQAAGLTCEEWRDEQSGHELQQLIVVSADRAVQGEFLHYAKGLELSGQLAHVFFDECHVAFTDTSYRQRLRDLWTLRYLECPFTALTATLMVQLEDILCERLCIPNAIIFRRSTARRTIRYSVMDSGNEPASVVATRYVQQLELSSGSSSGSGSDSTKRGVVYVRSYVTGQLISTALQCSFYKASADNKGELLQEWVQGPGGWIVATGALGTGINIEGIVYVVHVDRPYGLTSFAQQSGRGGRNGEISESIIITRVANSHAHKRSGIMSEYSVEQVDEDAMTEYIQARTCRRVVLGRYFDRADNNDNGSGSGSMDCHSTDSVFCDWCKSRSKSRKVYSSRTEQGREEAGREEAGREEAEREEAEREEAEREEQQEKEVNGPQDIARQLKEIEEEHKVMIKVMNQLQGQCIYCGIMIRGGGSGSGRGGEGSGSGLLHTYSNCHKAEADGCGFSKYEQWREGVNFGQAKHCWHCGLSQSICRRLERQEKGKGVDRRGRGGGGRGGRGGRGSIRGQEQGQMQEQQQQEECEYAGIMLPSMFILQQSQQHLYKIAQLIGFRGEWSSGSGGSIELGEDFQDWLNEPRARFGQEWWSNWMEVWIEICATYIKIARKEKQAWAL